MLVKDWIAIAISCLAFLASGATAYFNIRQIDDLRLTRLHGIPVAQMSASPDEVSSSMPSELFIFSNIGTRSIGVISSTLFIDITRDEDDVPCYRQLGPPPPKISDSQDNIPYQEHPLSSDRRDLLGLRKIAQEQDIWSKMPIILKPGDMVNDNLELGSTSILRFKNTQPFPDLFWATVCADFSILTPDDGIKSYRLEINRIKFINYHPQILEPMHHYGPNQVVLYSNHSTIFKWLLGR